MSPRIDSASTTPTLSEVIRTLIEERLVDLHTGMPGKIVTYDSLTQTASVQPTLMRKYESALIAKTLPVLPNCPVIHPKTALAHVHMPITTGDDCWIMFSERSLDSWKLSGSITDPSDRRKFNISDAVVIPGCSGLPGSFIVDDPMAVEIVNGAAQISLAVSSMIKLGKVTPFSVALGEKVLARLVAIESKLNSFIADYDLHVHATAAPGPPSPPIPIETPFVPDPSPIFSATTKVQT